jgi:hypothetical protein
MAYIGAQPNKQLTKTTSQSFNGTGSATAFTLNRAVNTGEELEVFVDNVQQEPGSGKSYTATGTTLTFDEAPPSGTGNVYVIYRGQAEVTTRLEAPDLSITTAKLAASAVTNAKIDTMAASKLTGALPAIDGSSLTGLTSGFTFLSDQTLSSKSQVTFTGIPSGANIVKFIVGKLSWDTNSTQLRMRLGDSGGLETSGYSTGDIFASTGVGSGGGSSEDSFRVTQWTGSANIFSINGEIVKTSSNEYLLTAQIFVNSAHLYFVSWNGYKTLSSELTQLQLYPSQGNFDAGIARVAYQ